MIILLHTPMGNAISVLFLSKIIPIFQSHRLGGLKMIMIILKKINMIMIIVKKIKMMMKFYAVNHYLINVSGDSEKTDEEKAQLVATLVSFLSQGADEVCSIYFCHLQHDFSACTVDCTLVVRLLEKHCHPHFTFPFTCSMTKVFWNDPVAYTRSWRLKSVDSLKYSGLGSIVVRMCVDSKIKSSTFRLQTLLE